MRAVFDTNVLVSGALLPASVPGRAFDHTQLNGNLLFSEATFAELQEVLSRPKFARYLNTALRDRFLARCLDASIPIEITRTIRACRDPNDDKFLEVVVNGSATMLVSGDADLLALDPFEGIPILSPATFLAGIGT